MTDIAYGMNFANTNGDAVHNPTYTTTQNRLQIDLNNPAPLFNLITLEAGTGFSIDLSTITTDSEQLAVINHNLSYVPQVYTTFYLIPINPSINPSTFANTYGIGQVLLGEGGNSVDFIGYTVNSTTLTFNHTVESFGGGSGSYTSVAPDYKVQIKYLICNNPQVQTITLN